jgi:segregation and condensation protein A
MADWNVSVGEFEGPLDLLLHLVRRQELDIHDIPIALITAQYLEYLGQMEELNLTVASEFFLMAATLVRIKAASLLPRPEEPEPEEDEADPRAALVTRLLEYEKFRLLAERLGVLRSARAKHHTGPARFAPAAAVPVGEETLYDLMAALAAMQSEEPETPHEVEPDEGSVEEMTAVLMASLSSHPKGLALDDLFHRVAGRARMVALFVALLELVRSGELAVVQRRPFTRVWLRPARQGSQSRRA